MLIPLTRETLEDLIPLIATGNQYRYYWGEPQDVLRRVLISVTALVLVLVLTVSLGPAGSLLRFFLGIGTGFYWLWVPIYLAGQRNSSYRRYPYGGLWQGEILNLFVSEDLIGREETVNAAGELVVVENRERCLNLEMGDATGFTTRLRVPLEREHQALRPGQRIQVVLLSKDRDLSRIARITDAYMPDRRLWVSDYPYLRRDRFVEVSDRLLGKTQRRRNPTTYRQAHY